MANVSRDVAERVERTRQLLRQVTTLTNRRLERESDTALLALSGWGSMPRRSHIFSI